MKSIKRIRKIRSDIKELISLSYSKGKNLTKFYHASPYKFDSFESKNPSGDTRGRIGSFFTDNLIVAITYFNKIGNKNGYLYEVDLTDVFKGREKYNYEINNIIKRNSSQESIDQALNGETTSVIMLYETAFLEFITLNQFETLFNSKISNTEIIKSALEFVNGDTSLARIVESDMGNIKITNVINLESTKNNLNSLEELFLNKLRIFNFIDSSDLNESGNIELEYSEFKSFFKLVIDYNLTKNFKIYLDIIKKLSLIYNSNKFKSTFEINFTEDYNDLRFYDKNCELKFRDLNLEEYFKDFRKEINTVRLNSSEESQMIDKKLKELCLDSNTLNKIRESVKEYANLTHYYELDSSGLAICTKLDFNK